MSNLSQINTSILPKKQDFVKFQGSPHLHFEAICIFVATGFFMDGDTYYRDQVCLVPSHHHSIDTNGFLIESKPWFEWHYTPNDQSFDQTLEAYIALLTQIIKDQVATSPIILPLSGGLDSRSQAMILKDLDNPVRAYSYSFDDGYAEHNIGAQIANICGFEFDSYIIPKGYLWNCIDELAQINQCYSDFNHPRQMAILPQLKQKEGIFSLGHWGDVLFDRGAPEGTSESDLVPLLLKKILKPGGLYLADQLWKAWGLDGNFKDYLISRIEDSLSKIKIENISAKVRAFKTNQWAHRWTTTNLSVFREANPITMPYYDDRMIEFICSVPENYLADRRLQIAHIRRDKALSNITWHAQKPFNLNNFHYNTWPYNMPYRIFDKLKREGNALMGKPFIQRNYELQFLGETNDKHLRERIFTDTFSTLIPTRIIDDIYTKFKDQDAVFYSHPISMLLTLALWNQHYNNR